MVVVVGQPQVGASVWLHVSGLMDGTLITPSPISLVHPVLLRYISTLLLPASFGCFVYQDGIGLVTGVTWSLGYKPCFVILKILTVIKRG